MSYPQLVSLSINDCHLSINDIQFVISQTPSLMYLKLISNRKEFDLAFNGSFWEQFIQTNFSSMVKGRGSISTEIGPLQKRSF
jgi:hypothetical protein